MKAVYSGRVTIMAEEITSFLRFIKETEDGELDWSEDTIKISGSKYLTIMKNLVLRMVPSRRVLFTLSLQITSLFTLFVLFRL